jgi:hypothetical protein
MARQQLIDKACRNMEDSWQYKFYSTAFLSLTPSLANCFDKFQLYGNPALSSVTEGVGGPTHEPHRVAAIVTLKYLQYLATPGTSQMISKILLSVWMRTGTKIKTKTGSFIRKKKVIWKQHTNQKLGARSTQSPLITPPFSQTERCLDAYSFYISTGLTVKSAMISRALCTKCKGEWLSWQ